MCFFRPSLIEASLSVAAASRAKHSRDFSKGMTYKDSPVSQAVSFALVLNLIFGPFFAGSYNILSILKSQ